MEYLLPHLLTNSATQYPTQEAVRMDGRALTYEQLDRLTNQVARSLAAAGVRRGDRVAVYVPKTLASLISIFGIMKAGAAYVPLDPNAPAKRLAYITRDCDVKVALVSSVTLKKLPGFFPEGTPIKTVLIVDDQAEAPSDWPTDAQILPWDQVLQQESGALPPSAQIDSDLAYILYTSGSTGSPKGVMISHRTIFTFVRWSTDKFQMTSKDRVTSHAPLHFDLSTFDLYATVRAGGTIILVTETLSTLPVQLAALLQNERVTITYLVPSILSLMVNYGKLDGHNLSALRIVLFAGEVFPMKYLRRLVAAIPHAAYYNLYGPTETNVCTYYQVQGSDVAPEAGDKPVPIGQACENMEVFAVDDQGQVITEPGKEGELWARGSCVAQGYWGDRAKTEKSFVVNPFQTLYPEFAYRTGDIVTLAPDRVNWIYVGRRDHMIKSRGYRVELGEIESALYRHDQVKEAAVVAVPDELLGNRIRAFVVPVEGTTATPKDIEVFCGTQVPKYMVPERIEFREKLPMTSSGKVDRPALLAQFLAASKAPASGGGK